MNIVSKEFDLANKYRVAVFINETRTMFLKFQEEVSDEAVFEEVNRILNLEAQQAVINNWTSIDYAL